MLTFNFSPFPVLATARLTLREPRPADEDALFPLRADPALMQFIPRPIAQTPRRRGRRDSTDARRPGAQ